jgi:drug/metabolite transporter (DMT)-like permease
MIAFIWGSTFVLVKAALNDASPLVLNSARMIVAAAALAIFYRKKIAVMSRSALIAGAVAGIFLFLGYAFQTSGLKLTTPSKSAFLTGTSSVLVPLVLVAIWRVHIHVWRVAGIMMALAGLFLMTVPGGGTGFADFARVNFGDILTLGCALSFTFHVIFVGRASQRFFAGASVFPADAHGDRSRPGYRHSMHGGGFQRAIVGAAVYSRYSYRADIHYRTRLCMADIFSYSS